jgi:hypothetical protein
MADSQWGYRRRELYTVLWVLTVVIAVFVLVMLELQPAPRAGWVIGFVLLLQGVLLALLGQLTVEVSATTLRWQFGWLGWPRWQVAIADIAALKVTRAPGSGSGIRVVGNRRLYNTVIGGPVVEITLRDGRVVLLGSPEADRLAAFIEARR